MKYLFLMLLLALTVQTYSQITPFEKSNGTQTATYQEAIAFYKSLAEKYKNIHILESGQTDAGYPLTLVTIAADATSNPNLWHKQKKIVIMINNGIHPGEPDGIDACMMLARDILTKKISLPPNIALGIIPIYNIGGSLNRNSTTRVNQNGPVSYGFRGNAQNLDLNRDFTKNDSKNAHSFATYFHTLDPDILIDNHVSDGADYQHTMTLIATQYDKLGGSLGSYLRDKFEPALYSSMSAKGWDMVPYVNFETASPDKGMEQFYDPPRFSSGYAALFHTMAFIPETHMLKPFKDRVKSTYDLMKTMIEVASNQAQQIIETRRKSINETAEATSLPLNWIPDSVNHTEITFKGYEQAFKTSEATGLQRMFYDHNKPFTKKIKYYNHFIPTQFVEKPSAYIIPQGWWAVIDILKLNHVICNPLKNDTSLNVEAYHIDDYRSLPRAYEKHHKNSNVKVSTSIKSIQFKKGDYIVPLNQPEARYITEMLEPTGDDSFFAWNFFDAILQQKEGYSDYRWEDIAAEVLKENPQIKQKLDEKKAVDSKFANNASAQLDFIYKNSKYYEPAHLQYPVYRLR